MSIRKILTKKSIIFVIVIALTNIFGMVNLFASTGTISITFSPTTSALNTSIYNNYSDRSDTSGMATCSSSNRSALDVIFPQLPNITAIINFNDYLGSPYASATATYSPNITPEEYSIDSETIENFPELLKSGAPFDLLQNFSIATNPTVFAYKLSTGSTRRGVKFVCYTGLTIPSSLTYGLSLPINKSMSCPSSGTSNYGTVTYNLSGIQIGKNTKSYLQTISSNKFSINTSRKEDFLGIGAMVIEQGDEGYSCSRNGDNFTCQYNYATPKTGNWLC